MVDTTTPDPVTALAAELGTIREMADQLTGDGHTVAECTGDLSNRCTGHDAERMADVLERLLTLADDWAATKGDGPGYIAVRACGIRVRSVIAAELRGETSG